jgi:hypothetical protein
MELFILVLSGSFALAAVAALWIFSHGRTASERRLAALGFEPCDSDAPALERVWRALTGCEASQELHVDHCKGRAVGWGMMHHFTVRQRPARERNGDGSSQPGASYPAYLLDLRNAGWASRGAVTLHVLPPASKVTRKALNGVINLGESRSVTIRGARQSSPRTAIPAAGSTISCRRRSRKSSCAPPRTAFSSSTWATVKRPSPRSRTTATWSNRSTISQSGSRTSLALLAPQRMHGGNGRRPPRWNHGRQERADR